MRLLCILVAQIERLEADIVVLILIRGLLFALASLAGRLFGLGLGIKLVHLARFRIYAIAVVVKIFVVIAGLFIVLLFGEDGNGLKFVLILVIGLSGTRLLLIFLFGGCGSGLFIVLVIILIIILVFVLVIVLLHTRTRLTLCVRSLDLVPDLHGGDLQKHQEQNDQAEQKHEGRASVKRIAEYPAQISAKQASGLQIGTGQEQLVKLCVHVVDQSAVSKEIGSENMNHSRERCNDHHRQQGLDGSGGAVVRLEPEDAEYDKQRREQERSVSEHTEQHILTDIHADLALQTLTRHKVTADPVQYQQYGQNQRNGKQNKRHELGKRVLALVGLCHALQILFSLCRTDACAALSLFRRTLFGRASLFGRTPLRRSRGRFCSGFGARRGRFFGCHR